MNPLKSYEYAEVIVGMLRRGLNQRLFVFLHVRDITGEKLTPNFDRGPLEALNLMGAQGWKLVCERSPDHGRMEWVAAAARRHDERIAAEGFDATEFLMMREVRD